MGTREATVDVCVSAGRARPARKQVSRPLIVQPNRVEVKNSEADSSSAAAASVFSLLCGAHSSL